MDPWHIIELLALALVGLGWRTLDKRASSAEARIHKMDGQIALLDKSHARSEERDLRFDKTIDRLERVVDHLANVLERGDDHEVRRKLSPPHGFPKPIPREEK